MTSMGQVGLGGQGSSMSSLGTMGGIGSAGSTNTILGTQTPLSDISTMGPSSYQASRDQLGKGNSSLSQIGQQAGITTQHNPQIGQQTTGFSGTTRPYNQ